MTPSSNQNKGEVWKEPELVQTFLTGVRAGLPYAADQLDVMVRVVAATGLPVRRFLDLGSGAGALSRPILARFPTASAVLVDFSEPMLAAAREYFPDPPHQLLQLDLSDPGWVQTVRPLGPFDAIVSGFAIHHLPDPNKRAIYAAVLDLLAPAAAFVHIEHVASASAWIETQFNELMIDSIHRQQEQAETGKSREDVARDFVYRPDKEANILAPLEVQLQWLREIGFSDVDCFFKVYELAVFGGRKTSESE